MNVGRSSQKKGRTAELALCRLLNEHGIPAIPGQPLNYGTEPDISGVVGVHVECKRSERVKISEWMAQAERDAARFQDGAPAVFFRRSREPWYVCMGLADWLKLYTEAKRR